MIQLPWIVILQAKELCMGIIKTSASIIRTALNDNLLRNSIVVLISSVVSGFLGGLYSVYVGRSLGPEEYSTVGAMLALYSLSTFVFGPLTSVLTKLTAEYETEGMPGCTATLTRNTLLHIGVIGLGLMSCILIASRPIADALRIPSPIPVVLTGLMLLCAAVFSVARGTLRGLQAFLPLALLLIVQALLRLGAGGALITLNLGASGALLAYPIATAVVVLIALAYLWPILSRPSERLDIGTVFRFSGQAVLLTACSRLLIDLPVLFAKRNLSTGDAGLFVAVYAVGNLTTELMEAFIVVILPTAASRHAAGQFPRDVLWRTIIYMILISIPILAALAIWGPVAIRLTYGAGFMDIGQLLVPYAAVRCILTMGRAFLYFSMATNRQRFAVPALIAAVLQICLLGHWGDDLRSLVSIATVSAVALAVLAIIFCFLPPDPDEYHQCCTFTDRDDR